MKSTHLKPTCESVISAQLIAMLASFVLLDACGGAAAAPKAESPPAATAAAGGQSDAASIVVSDELGHPHIGDPAPDFELIDQQGQPLKLSSLRGSVVLLALAASWCPFSQAEQAHLAQLAKDYAGKNVKVVTVVIADDEAGYHKYMDRTAMGMPVLFDADGKVALAYAPEHAHPTFKDRRKVSVTANLVIDPQGTIRFFTLVDTVHFDAELKHARQALDVQLSGAGAS